MPARGAPAIGTEAEFAAGLQHRAFGREIILSDVGAVPMPEAVFVAIPAQEGHIQSLDAFNSRRLFVSSVRQVDRPLDTLKIRVLQTLPADLQAGVRIPPA